MGERVAARALNDRGLRIIGTNVRTPRGEVDLLVEGPSGRLVAEVKACVGIGTPLDRVDDAKTERLWAMAGQLGAIGVVLVEVRLTEWGATVGWSPG